MKKIYKWLIIVSIILVIIIVLFYLFPLEKKATETTTESNTITEESDDVNNESLPTGEILSEGEGVADPNDDGVEWTENAVGMAVNQLPIISDNYSLFYDYGEGEFLAKINAQEGSSKAITAKEDVLRWLKDQNVDIESIDIKYLYSE